MVIIKVLVQGVNVLVIIFSYFIQSQFFKSIAHLMVANLARLGISVYCQLSVRSQYLVRLLSLCWITGGHTIHPLIEGLLPPTGVETTLPKFGLQSSWITDACHYTCLITRMKIARKMIFMITLTTLLESQGRRKSQLQQETLMFTLKITQETMKTSMEVKVMEF